VNRENFTITVVEEVEEASCRKYLHIVIDVSEELAASLYGEEFCLLALNICDILYKSTNDFGYSRHRSLI